MPLWSCCKDVIVSNMRVNVSSDFQTQRREMKIFLNYNSKHLEGQQKYFVVHHIFNSLGVCKCSETLSLVFDILYVKHCLECLYYLFKRNYVKLSWRWRIRSQKSVQNLVNRIKAILVEEQNLWYLTLTSYSRVMLNMLQWKASWSMPRINEPASNMFLATQ